MTALDKVIKKLNNASCLAKALNVSPMTVSHWRHRDNGRVPEGYLIKIFNLTGITPHELRPDIHPNPTSGIPQKLES